MIYLNNAINYPINVRNSKLIMPFSNPCWETHRLWVSDCEQDEEDESSDEEDIQVDEVIEAGPCEATGSWRNTRGGTHSRARAVMNGPGGDPESPRAPAEPKQPQRPMEGI